MRIDNREHPTDGKTKGPPVEINRRGFGVLVVKRQAGFCRVGVLAHQRRHLGKNTVGEYAHPTEKTGHFRAASV
jgi:hypothetical protein